MEVSYAQMFTARPPRVHPYTVVRVMANSAASHLAMRHQLRAAQLAVSNACASSAQAIGEALWLLRNGRADVALVGGSEAMLHVGSALGWQAMGVMAPLDAEAPEQSCRPFDDARKMIGGGARGLIERALVADGRDGSKLEFKAELDRMFAGFVEHYAAHIADRSRPFPQLEAALDRLAADGYRLAVCTNKLEWLSVRLLNTLDLTRHFAAICGQDTFGMQKPDPEVLRRTILKAGGKPDQAIMVGDSGTDIRTARAASLPVIAVTFGYSEVPIASLQPDRLISSYSELEAAIHGIETAAL